MAATPAKREMPAGLKRWLSERLHVDWPMVVVIFACFSDGLLVLKSRCAEAQWKERWERAMEEGSEIRDIAGLRVRSNLLFLGAFL